MTHDIHDAATNTAASSQISALSKPIFVLPAVQHQLQRTERKAEQREAEQVEAMLAARTFGQNSAASAPRSCRIGM